MRPMRAIGVFLGLAMMMTVAAGDGGRGGGGSGDGGDGENGGNGGNGGGGVGEDACEDCLSEWTDDVDDCSLDADICGSSADDLYDFGPCYRAFGACLSNAYDEAAICSDDCGDEEVAAALACGSYCEYDAGDCFGTASDDLAFCYDYCDSSECLSDCDYYFDLDVSFCADDETYCLESCGL